MNALAQIKPGKNYPASVSVTEKDGHRIKFLLQSYFVGMYCAIYTDEGRLPFQTGDHNDKTFVGKLKRDLARATKRGATVEIETLLPVKTSE